MAILITTRELGSISRDNLNAIAIDFYTLIMDDNNEDKWDDIKCFFDFSKKSSLLLVDYPGKIKECIAENSFGKFKYEIKKTNPVVLPEHFKKFIETCVKLQYKQFWECKNSAFPIYLFWSFPSKDISDPAKILILKYIFSKIKVEPSQLSLLLHGADWKGEIQKELPQDNLKFYFTHEPTDEFVILVLSKLFKGDFENAYNNFSKATEVEKKLKRREELIWKKKYKDEQDEIMRSLLAMLQIKSV